MRLAPFERVFVSSDMGQAQTPNERRSSTSQREIGVGFKEIMFFDDTEGERLGRSSPWGCRPSLVTSARNVLTAVEPFL